MLYEWCRVKNKFCKQYFKYVSGWCTDHWWLKGNEGVLRVGWYTLEKNKGNHIAKTSWIPQSFLWVQHPVSILVREASLAFQKLKLASCSRHLSQNELNPHLEVLLITGENLNTHFRQNNWIENWKYYFDGNKCCSQLVGCVEQCLELAQEISLTHSYCCCCFASQWTYFHVCPCSLGM